MNLILLVVACICLLVVGAFVFVFSKLGSRRRTLPVTGDWIGELSMARYRPMERLLDEADTRFLEASPGGGRKLARRLQAERRRLFRGYLHCLRRDFSRICMAIQILALASHQDRPDLVTILIKQKALFAIGLISVEYRLAMHTLGVGSVDVHGLIDSLEYMRLELLQLVQATVPAAA